jgi:hypothetical protein
MNVWPAHVMSMPAALILKVLLFVNAMLGFLEMDWIVLVSKSFIHVSIILQLSANYCNTFLFLDVNECLTRPCHHNANCTDTEGSYDCKCNVGFSGNGVTCTSEYCELLIILYSELLS